MGTVGARLWIDTEGGLPYPAARDTSTLRPADRIRMCPGRPRLTAKEEVCIELVGLQVTALFDILPWSRMVGSGDYLRRRRAAI